MPMIEYQLIIQAPIAQVYDVSQDYSVRYDWDPFPDHIEVVSGNSERLEIGNRVLIRSKLGMRMLVEFVQVKPCQRAAITMLEGPWFLRSFAGSWIFQEPEPGLTLTRFRYTLTTRPHWLSFVIEPIAACYFRIVVRQRLNGLKSFWETSARTRV
ncbi:MULTISPECIES: SRPBCC family protein [unclassified Pseudomonas]|uniref:SRPBCC family protein n=1 Tax=unclassified Pseudomonas TaxID=196821 RepID=UPI00244CCEFE|nr:MULTISPECIES: SRPBCC family protein [unclassified Pseudomonas]MDG9922832.1 SRPBCC family protein [Pseudomonas sp. GD04045]MDH0036887.1 SRPBCC family protein [Pseudomonas sp. GD04019]